MSNTLKHFCTPVQVGIVPPCLGVASGDQEDVGDGSIAVEQQMFVYDRHSHKPRKDAPLTQHSHGGMQLSELRGSYSALFNLGIFCVSIYLRGRCFQVKEFSRLLYEHKCREKYV